MLDLGQLHKNTVYKNQGTPYSLTRTITENGQPDILFHWHTDVEIIYVHEGTAKFHIDQKYFNSKAGDIILIRPNACLLYTSAIGSAPEDSHEKSPE